MIRCMVGAVALWSAGCFTVGAGLPTSGMTPAPRKPVTSPAEVIPAQAQTPAVGLSADELHAAALAAYEPVHSYFSRLRRRESKNGVAKPEELILFKERKNPFSVHFKWIGPEANGREVLYVKNQHADKLHVLTAAGDVPFVPAGRRMALARDSMLVKAANPHHDITDCGLSYNLKDLGNLYAAGKNPSTGVKVTALGPVHRPESPKPMPGVEITLPPGYDPDLPQGGKRVIYYCPETRLPTVYLCYDEQGREQNYNAYDRIQLTTRLDDDDFHPDKLWGPAAGGRKD